MSEAPYKRIDANWKSISDSDECVYELILSDFVYPLIPPDELDVVSFDPRIYFITSGDAVCKSRILSRDLWNYAGMIRKKTNNLKRKTKKITEFEKLCWAVAGQASKMINCLIKARGTAIFLETERGENGSLLVLCKNPRIKPSI